MKTVDCLYVTPPGELWIHFMDGEARKATEIEKRLVFRIAPETVSEIHWRKSPPRSPQKAIPLAV